MRMLAAVLLAAALPAALNAQSPDSLLQRLAPMLGSWEGDGWQLGPGGQRIEARVTERAELRLGGAAVVVEGTGRAGERVVHSALGVITWDRPSESYRIRAFRADGHMIDTAVLLREGALEWGFDDPRAGRIRYTARIAGDTWEETGELSRDGGASWQPFMAMTLRRTAP